MNIPVRLCAIYLSRGKGAISDGIIAAQNLYWKPMGKISRFSHVTFVGPDGISRESTVTWHWATVHKSFKIFGKTFTIPWKSFQLCFGIKVVDASKRWKDVEKEYELIAIQDSFPWAPEVWTKMIEYVNIKQKEGMKYGGFELFGTLWTILKWKMTGTKEKRDALLMKENPVNSKNAAYCCALVAEALQYAGIKDYLNIDNDPQADVSASNSTVDHCWYTKVPHKQEVVLGKL